MTGEDLWPYPALPMPWLLLQLAALVIWIGPIAYAIRRHGRGGLWWLLTAPLMLVVWGLVGFGVIWVGMALHLGGQGQ